MWIDRQDLLYTIRSAKRAPLLSAIAVVALSLGIGLNAGVFTLLNAMFLTPPTDVNPKSFVQIYPRYEGWFTGSGQYSSFTTEDYEAIRERATTLEDVAAWRPSDAVFEQGHREIPVLMVTCSYFHVFGIDRPLQGRMLTAKDCARGTTSQVVVLSEPFWKARLASNPHIVGQSIHLNGLPYTVVGVAPPDEANLQGLGVFVPYTVEPILDRDGANLLNNADMPWLNIGGRLRAGKTRADAQAELTTILRQQDRAYLERKVTAFNRKTSVELTNGSFIETPAFHDTVVELLVLILGPLSLVLLLACSNVTMLFLSRAVVRRGEIAVRLALGVGRTRLLRMLLLESVLMALMAGIASVVLAYRVPQMILNVVRSNTADVMPPIHPDWHVFGYLGALVMVAALASSLAPMHAAWKLDLVTALKGREASATSRTKLTGGLIVAQIAMSFVLLTAAVLFARMPGMVTAMDPGFETHQVASVPLEVDTSAQDLTNARSFYRSLEARLRATPGVESLAYESVDPFRQTPPGEIRVPGQEKGQGKPATVDDVSTEFFSTFGIRMLAGRAFRSVDKALSGGSAVAVVSQAFARQFWPGSDPIGKVVETSDDKRFVIVGVAADTRSERFGILDGPRIYTLRDASSVGGQLYVRFRGSASTMEAAVADAVKSLDRTQMQMPQTIWERLESQAEEMSSLAEIVVVMASIAVLLAITGVYAVLSFAINQRTREFSICMLLGASRGAIFQSVLVRGGRQIAVGLVCGVALAGPGLWVFADHMLKRSPFPIRGFDASVYATAAALLVAVSLAAMYLPALRAMRVDPMKALRSE
jgi:predicted permease